MPPTATKCIFAKLQDRCKKREPFSSNHNQEFGLSTSVSLVCKTNTPLSNLRLGMVFVYASITIREETVHESNRNTAILCNANTAHKAGSIPQLFWGTEVSRFNWLVQVSQLAKVVSIKSPVLAYLIFPSCGPKSMCYYLDFLGLQNLIFTLSIRVKIGRQGMGKEIYFVRFLKSFYPKDKIIATWSWGEGSDCNLKSPPEVCYWPLLSSRLSFLLVSG